MAKGNERNQCRNDMIKAIRHAPGHEFVLDSLDDLTDSNTCQGHQYKSINSLF